MSCRETHSGCPAASARVARQEGRLAGTGGEWQRIWATGGLGKSERDNESYRSVKEGLTEIKATQRDRQRHFNQLQSEMGPHRGLPKSPA